MVQTWQTLVYDDGQTCCRNRKPEESFRCNIEEKEKERRSIWEKTRTGMPGRVLFEPRRSIDHFKEWQFW